MDAQLVSDPLVEALDSASRGGIAVSRVAGPAGKTIRVALVLPKLKRGQKPRGSVIISPGRTEYIEKHADTALALLQRGFAVLIVDQRGQGWSDRLTGNPMAGHMDSFALAAEHLGLAVAAHAASLPEPRLLLCHSMGGAIGLQALLERQLPGVKAAVFSAPMWGLQAIPGARWIATGFATAGRGEAIAVTTPTVWAPEPFEGNAVTHDPAKLARNNALFVSEPALQIGGPTNGWLVQAYRLFDSLTPARLATLDIPVMVVSGAADTVVDNASHVRIAGQLPKARLRIVEGAKHEVLHERPDLTARFWEHFDSFVETALA
ncbi:MAG: lysophospholipase [Hyphomonadaceae bacterium]|nr:lysophospholipase [Hyphomonadaceae bacterium]